MFFFCKKVNLIKSTIIQKQGWKCSERKVIIEKPLWEENGGRKLSSQILWDVLALWLKPLNVEFQLLSKIMGIKSSFSYYYYCVKRPYNHHMIGLGARWWHYYSICDIWLVLFLANLVSVTGAMATVSRIDPWNLEQNKICRVEHGNASLKPKFEK